MEGESHSDRDEKTRPPAESGDKRCSTAGRHKRAGITSVKRCVRTCKRSPAFLHRAKHPGRPSRQSRPPAAPWGSVARWDSSPLCLPGVRSLHPDWDHNTQYEADNKHERGSAFVLRLNALTCHCLQTHCVVETVRVHLCLSHLLKV